MSSQPTVIKKSGSASILSPRILAPIALMLFSMFFGAGNLIFPPVLGAGAGANFTPAIIGFLLGSVALPIITVITMGLSGHDIRSLPARAGKIFAVTFSVAVYLAIGALFGIPRTAAVAYSVAISPITGWTSTSASLFFSVLFFVICYALAFRPGNLVNRLGAILTPALLLLLTVLIVMSFFKLKNPSPSPLPDYETSPLATGLFAGYMTMDSVAALAFGILVISAVKRSTAGTSIPVHKSTTVAALVAGLLLAIIYFGLAYIGLHLEDSQSYPEGAALLSAAALRVLNFQGQVVFGGIVVLACMTTATGLLAATSEFFQSLVPAVRYHYWLTGFAVISCVIATTGLETVLALAVPIIIFLYPIAITVVALTFFGHFLPLPLFYSFRFAVWTVAAWSFTTTVMPDLLSSAPLQEANFGWLIPALVALTIGLFLDLFNPERSRAAIKKAYENIQTQ
ncbi:MULTISPECIES: branched-chain amino acid transport system II carrier protein [unclassified Corynebacterium]|uniref:branched-chain amino acid transport system II carrier protein n=1 Tax=unclassified Corynebacterium TaxID=2624378 RepID=UPI00216AB05E|nr:MULTISPECIES: branched-chain amino acid transport system II carrier protein [unclassified Corynebacterium]MCS4490556.1 branched-chain amino acid transport system II carrier protein [Corynebacterium sp. ES2775-CONJ]MCS4492335.1 branched-chain amino acid transport system II carrier protein [Corynebacterium sp. ES2715-CONJ3]